MGIDKLYLGLSYKFGTPQNENVQYCDLNMLGYYIAILGFNNKLRLPPQKKIQKNSKSILFLESSKPSRDFIVIYRLTR